MDYIQKPPGVRLTLEFPNTSLSVTVQEGVSIYESFLVAGHSAHHRGEPSPEIGNLIGVWGLFQGNKKGYVLFKDVIPPEEVGMPVVFRDGCSLKFQYDSETPLTRTETDVLKMLREMQASHMDQFNEPNETGEIFEAEHTI